MSGSVAAVFDRAVLRRRRERVAAQAGRHDFLLARVAEDFADRLSLIKRTFPRAADLGAHHGLLARHLAAGAGLGEIVCVESVPDLLAQCPAPKVLADEEVLPFADASLDLMLSGLSLQLVNDLPGTLLQARKALKADGLLLAALLGGETLSELRTAFVMAESEIEGGASPRVAPFVDVRALGALSQRAGFALPVVDSDLVRVFYASPLDVMRELKAMGASNPLADRSRKPLRRETLARACEIYRERFSRADGKVAATFEIVTLTAWVPHESQPKPLRPGSAQMRLADALGRGGSGSGGA